MATPTDRLSRFARAWWRALPRQLLSALSGYLLCLSFPPHDTWYLAPLGIAVLTLVLTWRGGGNPTIRRRAGFGYSYIAGVSFLLPLIPWVGTYVGPVPWLALGCADAVFIGLFGLVAVTVARWRFGAPWLTPVWIATAWSLTEWLRAQIPFGGFPWGRLAFGQPRGWLLPLASLGGAPLLSFGVALTGTGIAFVVLAVARAVRPPESGGEPAARPRAHARRVAAALAVVLVAPVAAFATAPTLPGMQSGGRADGGDGYLTVAAVQGNVPQLGLDFEARRRAVLDMHVERTLQLADAVRAGKSPRPDVVVWPENSSDVDPLRDPDAYAEISHAAATIGAPILVGAVLVNDDGTTTNSVIVWDPLRGPEQRHDKRILQPFGEYLPFRSFFEHFSQYAKMAGHFVPGHDNGVVTADGTPIAVATCYEVAFDRALREPVRDGAQFIAVPTNNATYSTPQNDQMTFQQLAMSRVRAVEHGRTVVVAATTGVSAIIAPDGAVQQESPLFVPAALTARIPLRTGITIATRIGAWPEWTLCLIAVIAFVASTVQDRRNAVPGAGTRAAPTEPMNPNVSARTARDAQTVPAAAGEEEPDGSGRSTQ